MDRLLFLHLPSFENFFSPPVGDIRRGHVADALVVAVLVVAVDELRHGRPQTLRAGVSRGH